MFLLSERLIALTFILYKIRVEQQISEREECHFTECAMTLLIELAFLDNAFQGISTREQLYAIEPVGNELRTIPWKLEAREKYVLQQPRQPDRPLDYNTFCNLLKEAARKANLVDDVTPYCIRRFGADELISMSTKLSLIHI